MSIFRTLNESEQVLFNRINTMLKYQVAIHRVKTIAEAKSFVIDEYFRRIKDWGDWDTWEHKEYVREIFNERNIEIAFEDVESMTELEKESFVFEIEGYHM
jgi:hypothetical protein